MRRQTASALGLLLTLISGAAADAAAPGTFQPVGDMTTPRVFTTATLLNDGTVLVAGGWKRGGPSGNDLVSQETAERFDPKTNTFSAVGAMASPRSNHAAVRLQDGRVLIVAGSNDRDAQTAYPGVLIATAELYDPSTGKFSATGDMITPRVTATATLLANGQVLITGGLRLTQPYVVDAAELYDPATGKFAATGPMTIPRNNHSAVALPDGRVAILGGLTPTTGQPTRSVEIYDPSTGTFARAGEMAEARAFFRATLLPDGRILAIGGVTSWNNPPTGPEFPDKITSSVEIYDPATRQAAITGNMAQTRWVHGAGALADGRILVVGGQWSATTVTTPEADLIDPVTGKVSPGGTMTTTRNQAVLVLLPDGRVLVTGGRAKAANADVYVP